MGVGTQLAARAHQESSVLRRLGPLEVGKGVSPASPSQNKMQRGHHPTRQSWSTAQVASHHSVAHPAVLPENVYVRVYVCMHCMQCMYVCMYVRKKVGGYVCMYVIMYVCMYVCKGYRISASAAGVDPVLSGGIAARPQCLAIAADTHSPAWHRRLRAARSRRRRRIWKRRWQGRHISPRDALLLGAHHSQPRYNLVGPVMGKAGKPWGNGNQPVSRPMK